MLSPFKLLRALKEEGTTLETINKMVQKNIEETIEDICLALYDYIETDIYYEPEETDKEEYKKEICLEPEKTEDNIWLAVQVSNKLHKELILDEVEYETNAQTHYCTLLRLADMEHKYYNKVDIMDRYKIKPDGTVEHEYHRKTYEEM